MMSIKKKLFFIKLKIMNVMNSCNCGFKTQDCKTFGRFGMIDCYKELVSGFYPPFLKCMG